MRKMTTICGLNEIKDQVALFVQKAALYRRLGKKPPTLIIFLSEKLGRTTVANYVVDRLSESGLHDMSYCREELLELDFDGTYANATDHVESLEDNADYANEFTNICAVSGLEKLASHSGETQVDIFLNMIEKVAKSGYLIVFASSEPKAMEAKLLEKVKAKLSTYYIEVAPEAYTLEDYANAVQAYLEDLGVIVNGNAADILGLDAPDMTMTKAIEIADKAVLAAELKSGRPVLTIEAVKHEREVK